MAVLRYDETPARRIRQGAERRQGHTENLMMTVIDFYDGPKPQPDPPHSHPHEQISYVARGEILVLIDGEQTRLLPGDMFAVPSGKPHSIQLLAEHVRLVDCFTPVRDDLT